MEVNFKRLNIKFIARVCVSTNFHEKKKMQRFSCKFFYAQELVLFQKIQFTKRLHLQLSLEVLVEGAGVSPTSDLKFQAERKVALSRRRNTKERETVREKTKTREKTNSRVWGDIS